MNIREISEIHRAKEFATKKHEGQGRSGDRPYIVHPIGVADLLLRVGIYDCSVLQAALLHDVIEDTKTTPHELELEFGLHVAAIVFEVTDDPNLSKKEQKAAQLANARKLSYEAALVKVADKLYNTMDLANFPPTWRIESQRGYLEGIRSWFVERYYNTPWPGIPRYLADGEQDLVDMFYGAYRIADISLAKRGSVQEKCR